ncbi:hypothetical protein [Cohnella soli]|uniref:Uncharacterized protein n=1 Tax=Cohnella soli TaxID=425005 RepID=A0ABW0HM82_9BACL
MSTNDLSFCKDCGKPEWRSLDEFDSIISECICESARVKCDLCMHRFLRKDMSLNDMFLSLCKMCNQAEPHLMDNLAVARFNPSDRPAAMLCVQEIDGMLQLTMRAYHLGVSIVFPAMTKQNLVARWLFGPVDPSKEEPESNFLFDAAFLRMMDDYMGKSEVASIRRTLMERAKAEAPQGDPISC